MTLLFMKNHGLESYYTEMILNWLYGVRHSSSCLDGPARLASLVGAWVWWYGPCWFVATSKKDIKHHVTKHWLTQQLLRFQLGSYSSVKEIGSHLGGLAIVQHIRVADAGIAVRLITGLLCR